MDTSAVTSISPDGSQHSLNQFVQATNSNEFSTNGSLISCLDPTRNAKDFPVGNSVGCRAKHQPALKRDTTTAIRVRKEYQILGQFLFSTTTPPCDHRLHVRVAHIAKSGTRCKAFAPLQSNRPYALY